MGPFINFPELFGLVVDDSNLDVSFVSTLLKYIFNSDCWGFYDKDFCKRIFRFKDEESHPFEREGNDFMESLGHSFEVKGILDFRYSALNSNGPLVKFLSDNRFFEMDPETKDIRVKEELESFLPFMAMYHDFKKYTFFVNLSDLLKEQSKELEFSNHLDASEFGIKHQFIIAYLQYLHEHVLLNNDALLALKFESRLVDEQSIPDLTEALSLEDTFRESALKLEKILISDVKAEDGRSFPYQMVDEEGEFNVRYARHSLLDCLLIITGNSIEVNKRIERKQDFLIKFFDQPDNRQGNSLLLLKSINDINNDFSNIESILKEAIKKLNQRTYCIITNKSAMCSVFFRLSVLNYDYMVEENPEKKDFLLKTMICVAAYLMQGLPHCLSGKEAAFSESLKTLMDYKNQSTEDYGINYFVHQMTENLLKHIFEFRELSDGKFKVPEEAVMFLTAIRSFLSVNDDDDSDDISFQAYGLYGVETSESENKIENLVPFLNFFQHSDDRIVSMVREKMNKRKSYRLLTEMHSVLEKDSEDEDEDDDLCFTAMCSLSEGPFYEELVTTIWDYAMHPDIFLPFFVEGFAKIGETGTQLLKSFIKTKYQIVLDDEFLKKIPEETRTKIIYLLLLENNFIKPPSN
ncbi:MAG: hypothetical protein LBJ71_03665 [Holosporaceae bacterium]|nr:hypothetical protein [Holosporaceae bacterium]